MSVGEYLSKQMIVIDPRVPSKVVFEEIQPVVQEMFATVQAAGSSLFGLFSSCSTTFDSTFLCRYSAQPYSLQPVSYYGAFYFHFHWGYIRRQSQSRPPVYVFIYVASPVAIAVAVDDPRKRRRRPTITIAQPQNRGKPQLGRWAFYWE
eukprot:scaffold29723_cov101-Isochrysis_galbana.AAC.1